MERLVKACKEKCIPIRIGVNAGSLEAGLLARHNGKATPEAMVESALGHVAILEENGFFDILISLKASDIDRTVQAYRLLWQGWSTRSILESQRLEPVLEALFCPQQV